MAYLENFERFTGYPVNTGARIASKKRLAGAVLAAKAELSEK